MGSGCGRHGNSSHWHHESVIVVQGVNGPQDVVVVLQRLAHSHQHHTETLRCFFQQEHNLGNDLTGREVSSQSQLASQAEGATKRTTNL